MDKKLYPRIGEEVIWVTLDNGLPVCIVPKKGFSRKYALFATRYGGMDMRFRLDGQWLDTPAGIAHYLEHKMFDTEDGNALQELAMNGAEPNAFTSNAITCYYFDSTEKFYENLEILLSFVSVPYFTDESVEKEQGIIGQEIGMIEDNPEWQVYKQLMQSLYHTSPARTPVAGSVESIREITAQTLYDCHKAFYTPANMCLVVVGDVEPQQVLDIARRVLPKDSGELIERDYGVEEPTEAARAYAEERMEVSMPSFLVGFKCPPQHGGEEQHRFAAIGELACDVLMGESSPLYARLYSQGLLRRGVRHPARRGLRLRRRRQQGSQGRGGGDTDRGAAAGARGRGRGLLQAHRQRQLRRGAAGAELLRVHRRVHGGGTVSGVRSLPVPGDI